MQSDDYFNRFGFVWQLMSRLSGSSDVTRPITAHYPLRLCTELRFGLRDPAVNTPSRFLEDTCHDSLELPIKY